MEVHLEAQTDTYPVATAGAPSGRRKPPVDPIELEHRNLRQGEFWRAIPAYRDVDEATFLDHLWQARKSVKNADELLATIEELADPSFIADAREGFKRAPMSVRVSPYAIAAIDWRKPYSDPIRTQFIPVASKLRQDHPRLTLDSLHELDDSPVPGLTHRYVDKALFLPLNTCPVYCRFCTRSYAIGLDTEMVDKVPLAKTPKDWQAAFDYIASRPELEDIVISGGDAYQLPAKNLRLIGDALLDIPHIKRMRFATKGPAIMPMKLLTDTAWVDALAAVVERGRTLGKDVVLHTHFNSPNEITWITQQAIDVLFKRGIVVRNQSVLMRGVNDDPEVMRLLVKRLSYINVHPYYVYMHDMVRGVEELRTSVATSCEIEKFVRGSTAGFNTPLFICDAPGGGGKRDIHSFDYYDRENGIVVYSAPSVKPGQHFIYFDPLDTLSPEAQGRWEDKVTADAMIADAIEQAGGSPTYVPA
ncbi:MAG: KamA family radical SAM protein [Candidatus Eremiobacteraeota bacterium]|nr:KamA family radical SAM protein [Candidatus Eremiobacteraeota bacterium]MBC5801555.1 KamA family radical SAM protein [Candidatus Eremiobacteraeota bacterium]MBC5821445.1 KamA family radical SAM protein [Candidatus Eremiobacteraeota bacterium]